MSLRIFCRSLIFLRASIFLVCLVHCSFAFGSEVVLDVWGLRQSPEEPGLSAVIDAFERENPGVKVRLLGSYSQQKLMTSFLGEVPPDVIRQDRFSIAGWASKGVYQPLDSWLGLGDGPKKEEYYPAIWDESIWEGKTYGIPEYADNRILYVNFDLIRKAFPQIKKEELPELLRTWDDLKLVSLKLTQLDSDQLPVEAGFIPNMGSTPFQLYAMQNGGEVVSEDGKKCTFSDQKNLETLEFLKELQDIAGSYDSLQPYVASLDLRGGDPFWSGQVAMLIADDGYWRRLSLREQNFKVVAVPLPVPEGWEVGTPRTLAGGFSFAIPSHAKNKELAWEFVKFMTSSASRYLYERTQYEHAVEKGEFYVPRLHPLVNQMKLSELPTDEIIEVHRAELEFSGTRAKSVFAQKLWDESEGVMLAALSGSEVPADALSKAENRVQRVMDESYASEEKQSVNLFFVTLLFVIICLLGLGLWIFSDWKRGSFSRKESLAGLAIVSPWLFGFVVFILGPVVASLILSFTVWYGVGDAKFIGLSNFSEILSDDSLVFVKSIKNILYLAVIGIPLTIATGLWMAILLQGAGRGLKFFRTVMVMPSLIPAVASTFIWVWLLFPDPGMGFVNNVWYATLTQTFGWNPPGWFFVEEWAKPSLILMGVWGAGSGFILWLAGLKGIDQNLYDAAVIDGAKPRDQFWKITIPQLSGLMVFQTIVSLIAVTQIFDQTFVASGGEQYGPGESLATPVYVLFNQGFSYMRMGNASAIAWTLLIIVLFLTLVLLRGSKKFVFSEVEEG